MPKIGYDVILEVWSYMGAHGEKETPELSSDAWLRHGPKGLFGGMEPGTLQAIGDRVSFVTKKGPAFEAIQSEIKVNWPRIEFGGGVHLTVVGKVYRLSFAPPAGPEGGLGDIRKARASGNAWKAYFGARYS